MTLTELRYIVALAAERHFGRAAAKCFVSQPTLSVAVRKLEDELGVTLFERNASDVQVTPVGARVIDQAQRVLEEAALVKGIAQQGRNQLVGTLRIGVIYTIGPYLMPALIPALHRRAPEMPLLIQENYTVRLAAMLKGGELDVVIVSLPFEEAGVLTLPVYDEPFRVVLPSGHAWAKRKAIAPSELGGEEVLLLGAGNCFRDQVLQACPTCNRTATSGIGKTLEGSSLETIRQMVASGTGITVLPSTAAESGAGQSRLLAVRPFAAPVPERRVVLAWRASFPRPKAVEAVRRAVLDCRLPGASLLKPG